MKIIFATNNQHKLDEIRSILGGQFDVLSLNDIGCHVDIPETGQTLEENALMKARYVFNHYGISCFADDTGLEVEALGGEPGVYSARYAGGDGHNSEANMRKLLQKLGNNNNRNARFRTVITLILKNESLKASSTAISTTKSKVLKASATTPFLFPKATTRVLPNWVWTSKMLFRTEPAPPRSWWIT